MNIQKGKPQQGSTQGGILLRILLAILLIATITPITPSYADDKKPQDPQTVSSEANEPAQDPQAEAPTPDAPATTPADPASAAEAPTPEAPAADSAKADAPTADNPKSLEVKLSDDKGKAEATEEAAIAIQEEPSTPNNSLSGILWHDQNTNGKKDEGEPGIANYPVVLYHNGEATETIKTEHDGTYVFTDLEPGTYQVAVTANTVDGTEYLIPMKDIQAGKDNKFDMDDSADPVISITEEIEVEADSVIEDVDAGVRGEVQIAPMAMTEYANSEATLQTAIFSVSNGGTIIITGSFGITGAIGISGSKSFTIKSDAGGPYTITQQTNGQRHLEISSGSTLTLENITLSGNGTAKQSGILNGGIWIRNATLVMSAGATVQNCHGQSTGGAVRLTGGSFTMNAGSSVSNNTEGLSGAGVLIEGGSFVMSGGSISGNNADAMAGGVYVQTGTFTMSGGSIDNNVARAGGGVWITNYYGTAFTMTGGSITNNTATIPGWVSGGGGIYVGISPVYNNPELMSSYSNLSISPGAVVSGNVSGQTFFPPVNAADFATRATNPFDGYLLDNDNINYRNPNYMLVYKANNGKSEPDYRYDTGVTTGTVNITAITQATAGFTAPTTAPRFAGWNTKDDGTGIPYAAGDTIPVSGNMILYAQWAPAYDLKVNYVDRDAAALSPANETLAGAVSIGYPYNITPRAFTNKVAVGWYMGSPQAPNPALNPMSQQIAGSQIIGNTEITIVYGNDKGQGGNPSGPDGTEDFDVTRKWVQSDGTTAVDASLPDLTAPWNVGEAFTLAHDNGVVIPTGWTYSGYTVTTNGTEGAKVAAPAPPNVQILATSGDVTIKYYYDKSVYPMTVHHVDRAAATQSPLQTLNGTHGSAFTPSYQSITGYVPVGWYLGTPNASTVVTETLSPKIDPVTGPGTITLVYGRDKGQGGNPSGPDGTEDFDVHRKWRMNTTLAPIVSLPDIAEPYNVGEVFTKAHNAGVTIPAGLTYVGFKYDTDLPAAPLRSTSEAISITMGKADAGITYFYDTTKYDVNVTYRYDANDGTKTALPGSQAMQVYHGSNLDTTSTTPRIKVPTVLDDIAFDKKTPTGWAYSTTPNVVTPGLPSFTNITSNFDIILIYSQDGDGNGKPDFTVIEKHQNSGTDIITPITHYVDFDASITLAKSATVEGYGYVYLNYVLDGGAPNVATSMNIANPTADHEVVFNYDVKAYTVTVEHLYRDNAGVETAIAPSIDYTLSVDHNDPTPALTIPVLPDMLAKYWNDGGAEQLIGTPGIANVVSNRKIQIIYVQDMNNNGVQDYTVTEKFQTEVGGTLKVDNTVYVDENDPYSYANPDDWVPPLSGLNYTKYKLDLAADVGGSVKPVTIVSVTADHTIIYKYLPNDYTVTVTYEYRKNDNTVTILGSGQTESITHGGAFTETSTPALIWPNKPATPPVFPKVVYVGWERDGIPQSGDPGIPSVVDSTNITLIYKQDEDQNGVQDYWIHEVHETSDINRETKNVLVNDGDPYNGVTSATVLAAGYTYDDYDIDAGTTTGLAPNLPAITSVTAEHDVIFNYSVTQYPIEIEYKYIDSSGTVSNLPLPTGITSPVQVDHGDPFNGFAPEYSLSETTDAVYQYKTFSHWTLDTNPAQNNRPIQVNNVTAGHKVTIYYVQDMNENRSQDFTVVENHKAGASTLETKTTYVDTGTPFMGSSSATVIASGYTYQGYAYDFTSGSGATFTIPSITKDYEITYQYIATTYPVSVTYIYRPNGGVDTVIGAAVNQTSTIAHNGSFTASRPTSVDHADFAGKTYVGWSVDGGAEQTGLPTLSNVVTPGSGGTYDIVLIYAQDGDGDGNPDVTVTKNHLENRGAFPPMVGSVVETKYVNFPANATTATFADAPKNFGAKFEFDHYDVNGGVAQPQYVKPNLTVNLHDANFTVNYYYEKLAPPAPFIQSVFELDTKVRGTGYEAGSTLTVIWPDSTTDVTTVKPDGTWEVAVPGALTLAPGDVIKAEETNDWAKTGPQGSAIVGRVMHQVKVSYEYKDGTALPGAASNSVAHKGNLTVTDPTFKEKVLINWKLDGVEQNNVTPQLTNVLTDHKVVLIYGQDKGGNPSKPGPDGIEDFTVEESCVCAVYGNTLNGPREIYVNKADTYNGTPKTYTGRFYQGYQLNGGAAVAAPGTPTVANVQDDHKVVYLHNFNTYTVTVKHVDEAGKGIAAMATASKDYTQKVRYNESWSGTATAIKGYDFVSWSLDGVAQTSDAIKIDKVTKDVTVTLAYKKTEVKKPEEPKQEDHGNYNFIKKPNVKNVAAGETVNYTFANFGNNWPVELEEYSIIDKPDMGLDFKSASLPAFNKGAGVTYDVIYHTNYVFDRVMYSGVPADQAFSFVAPELSVGEYITALELRFGTVPAGFAVGDTMQMQFKVWDNPPATTLTNVGILSYKVDGKYREFVSGSGSITIGGWFAPKTGDATTATGLAVLAGVAIVVAAVATRNRRRASKR